VREQKIKMIFSSYPDAMVIPALKKGLGAIRGVCESLTPVVGSKDDFELLDQ